MRHHISLVPPLRMGPVEEAEAPMLTKLTRSKAKAAPVALASFLKLTNSHPIFEIIFVKHTNFLVILETEIISHIPYLSGFVA